MKLTQTGRGAYEVSSDSDPIPHQVDLELHDGVGFCSCSDWKYRCYPNYKRAKALGEELFVPRGKGKTLCKHVKAAAWEDWKLFTVERSKQNYIQQA